MLSSANTKTTLREFVRAALFDRFDELAAEN